jgi:hypothetical protein
LRFGYRSTSADVGDDFESGEPENPGIAVGTACLSVVEREILLFPAWRPSFVLPASADIGISSTMFLRY